MEQDGREVPGTGVARSQNVAYVIPHNWTSIAQFLEPLVQRIDDASHDIQLIVITSDAELAAATAAAAVKLLEGRPIDIVAATTPRRAARLIRARSPQIVAGAPDTLIELVRSASIKLDAIRMVCIAWADELVTLGALPSLETLMSELPKDSARTVVTAELTAEVEELLERYARRARRVVSPVAEDDLPVSLDYVSVSPQTRLTTLRRVLDALDPASGVVFVRDANSSIEVNDLLIALGYRGPDATVKIAPAAPPGTELVVLFDLPATRAELREATSAASRSVALIQPRQLASLRSLAAGGIVKPLTLEEPGMRARDRDARLRSDLRAVLAQGQFGRELMAVEQMLGEYDGVEIAAAAVQLLERERAERASAVARSAVAAPSTRETGGMVRLFVTIGSRDNARPGDLVGAIANTAGITSAEVGKIDVRESHSIVEVATSVADTVIETVTGTTIKGRRVIVRREREGGGKREGARGTREGGRRAPGRGRPGREPGREPRGERRPTTERERPQFPPRGEDRE